MVAVVSRSPGVLDFEHIAEAIVCEALSAPRAPDNEYVLESIVDRGQKLASIARDRHTLQQVSPVVLQAVLRLRYREVRLERLFNLRQHPAAKRFWNSIRKHVRVIHIPHVHTGSGGMPACMADLVTNLMQPIPEGFEQLKKDYPGLQQVRFPRHQCGHTGIDWCVDYRTSPPRFFVWMTYTYAPGMTLREWPSMPADFVSIRFLKIQCPSSDEGAFELLCASEAARDPCLQTLQLGSRSIDIREVRNLFEDRAERGCGGEFQYLKIASPAQLNTSLFASLCHALPSTLTSLHLGAIYNTEVCNMLSVKDLKQVMSIVERELPALKELYLAVRSVNSRDDAEDLKGLPSPLEVKPDWLDKCMINLIGDNDVWPSEALSVHVAKIIAAVIPHSAVKLPGFATDSGLRFDLIVDLPHPLEDTGLLAEQEFEFLVNLPTHQKRALLAADWDQLGVSRKSQPLRNMSEIYFEADGRPAIQPLPLDCLKTSDTTDGDPDELPDTRDIDAVDADAGGWA